MTLPFSETKLVDDTKPSECSVISDIDNYMRETREAVNILHKAYGPSCKAIQLLPGDNSLAVDSLGLILVATAAGSICRINSLSGGTAGQIIIIKVARGDIPMVNPIVMSHDDVMLFLQDNRSYEMWEDDFIMLKHCQDESVDPFCARILGGGWTEIGRTQARKESADSARFWISVDKYGATFTETI